MQNHKAQSCKGIFAILGGGLFQCELIKKASQKGYKTLVLDKNPEAAGASLADIFLPVDISDKDAVCGALRPYKQDLALCGTVGTDFSDSVAQVNEVYSLPGPRPNHSGLTTHKGKMRDFLGRHGINQMAYFYTSQEEEALAWLRQNPSYQGYVIKPARNMGARGVLFFRDPDELSYAFEYAASYDKNKEVIVEHYLEAQELSVDALVFQGEVYITGIADRLIFLKDNHYFIEKGHLMPSVFHEELHAKVRELFQKIAQALEKETGIVYHGALKGDIRLTQEGDLYVGEIASRLSGGFMSTHTYPLASGNDLLLAYIELLEGKRSSFLQTETPPRYERYALEHALFAPPGEIISLEIPQKFFNQDGVKLFFHYRPKDILLDLKSNVGKLANIIVTAPSPEEAKLAFESLAREIKVRTGPVTLKPVEIERLARKKFNHAYCWVCKVCDGEHCASSVPGMGGRGNGASFRDNLYALAEYLIIPRYLCLEEEPFTESDMSLELFGKTFQAPLASAPITGSITNMGGSITEWEYAIETATACHKMGLLPFFGDGAKHNKYKIGLYAIAETGPGCPVFKPRNLEELERRVKEAESSGALAWGIDIDGISFKTLEDKKVETQRKSQRELASLAACSRLPFFVKGVLSVEDARLACEAGAAAIIVSNHGGRVLESAPGSARVLPEIADFVRKNFPHVRILADGGIRSGGDVFKMLALGAEAVLVGRPVAIYTVALGRLGVEALFRRYLDELRQIMRVCGLKSLKEIHAGFLKKSGEKTFA